ncbi:hypothetical protein FKM82_014890 [Ascaphus truei]
MISQMPKPCKVCMEKMLFLQRHTLPRIATATTVIHTPAHIRMHYNRLAIQVHPYGETAPHTKHQSHIHIKEEATATSLPQPPLHQTHTPHIGQRRTIDPTIQRCKHRRRTEQHNRT